MPFFSSTILLPPAANKHPPLRVFRGLAISTAMALAVLSAPHANAQSGTVKIIVPSTAGGGADIIARLLADQISRAHNVTMIVENRPGAGNTIGTEAASRAAPDGNTVLVSTPEFVINAHLRKLSYDPLTSFESVCYLARSPQILVVNSSAPYRTLADLFDAARAKPGALTLASAGPASSPHIAFEALKRAVNVDITYVPYPGSAPAVNAVLGGHVTSVLASYPNVVGQVKSGQLRALAATSLSRLPQLPDVPTVAESGFKDFEADLWLGTAVPAKTPQDAIARLSGWFRAALQVPDVKSKLEAQGLFPVGTCGAEFDAFIRKEYEQFGRTIREANIQSR